MQIIWYNSKLGKYQFGDSENYELEQSRVENEDSLTVLMELPLGDHSLANKVITELNVAEQHRETVF